MAFNHVTKIDNLVPVRNVLASLFDKAGIEDFAKGLLETCPGVRFFSTGGTYKALAAALGDAAGDRLVQVSDYTGQPEMQGGLVKTLDFKIYLGLLGEHYNEAHQADLKRTGAVEIDMVVGNLYPFQKVAALVPVADYVAVGIVAAVALIGERGGEGIDFSAWRAVVVSCESARQKKRNAESFSSFLNA